jgi:hypothetical protein
MDIYSMFYLLVYHRVLTGSDSLFIDNLSLYLIPEKIGTLNYFSFLKISNMFYKGSTINSHWDVMLKTNKQKLSSFYFIQIVLLGDIIDHNVTPMTQNVEPRNYLQDAFLCMT